MIKLLLTFLSVFVLSVSLYGNGGGDRRGGDCGIHFSSEVIGFSRDLNFLAVKRSGIDYDNDMYIGDIIIVNVDKNSYAGWTNTAKISGSSGGYKVVEKRIQKEARALLKKYNIQTGNKGEIINYRKYKYIKRADYNKDFKDSRKYLGKTVISFKPKYNKYVLTLLGMPARGANCPANARSKPAMIDLRLRVNKEPTIILQKDKRLPRSRRCSSYYTFNRIHVISNKIAVFINYTNDISACGEFKQVIVTGSIGK